MSVSSLRMDWSSVTGNSTRIFSGRTEKGKCLRDKDKILFSLVKKSILNCACVCVVCHLHAVAFSEGWLRILSQLLPWKCRFYYLKQQETVEQSLPATRNTQGILKHHFAGVIARLLLDTSVALSRLNASSHLHYFHSKSVAQEVALSLFQ